MLWRLLLLLQPPLIHTSSCCFFGVGALCLGWFCCLLVRRRRRRRNKNILLLKRLLHKNNNAPLQQYVPFIIRKTVPAEKKKTLAKWQRTSHRYAGLCNQSSPAHPSPLSPPSIVGLSVSQPPPGPGESLEEFCGFMMLRMMILEKYLWIALVP